MTIHDDVWSGRLGQSELDQYRASTSFDIDAQDSKRGLTPLSAAAYKGHNHVVKTLLDNGASAKKLSKGDRTPLWFAAAGTMHRSSRSEIIRLLLDKGAEINKPSPVNGGYTPLMKVIVEWKDPQIISQLVDAGAVPTIENDKNETAKDLAEKTKDRAVIKALLPKDERETSRAEFISLIVKFVLFVVAWINGSDTSDMVSGIVVDLYKISGQKAPEIAKDIPEAQTVDEYKDNLNRYIADTGMDDFFEKDDPFLTTLAEKAAKLKKNPSSPFTTDDQIRDLTKLSLYQPVIYCDDSSSMSTDKRNEAQRELVKRMARISTYIVPDNEGVDLYFINSAEKGIRLRENEIDNVLSRVQPWGATELGTKLIEKVLNPIYHQVALKQLKRPVVISIITDGCPSAPEGSPERTDTLKNAIIDCRKRLVKAGYEPEAVLFSISQIGTDEESKTFLDGLRREKQLEKGLYVTTDRLDAEYESLKQSDADLEQWLLKRLVAPILDRDVV